MIKKLTVTCAVAFACIGVQAPSAQAQSIVDIASSEPNLSALVDAVVAQDLADTLASDGSFTVFAPTNDAFANLPSYVGTALADNPELLTDILLYHVSGEELFAEEVLRMRSIHTLQGESVRVQQRGNSAFINSSELIALDIDADNGVVHLIDRVLLPKSVYVAVLQDIREQILALRHEMRDVRHDWRSEKRVH